MIYLGNTFIRIWERFLSLFLPPKGFLLEPKEAFIPIAEPSEALVTFAKKTSLLFNKTTPHWQGDQISGRYYSSSSALA